jgi:hypothetical protein
MIYRKYLVAIIFLVFLFSCNKSYKGEVPFQLVLNSELNSIMKWQNEENINLTLEEDEIVEIPVDSTSWNHSLYPFFKEIGSAQYFITNNPILNGIDFYNLENRNLDNRIFFPKEGENGLLSIDGFFVKSKDSIFIFSKVDEKLFLINWNGEIKTSFKLPEARKKLNSNFFSQFFIFKDQAVFKYTPFLPLIKIADSLTSYSFDLVKRKGKVIGTPILSSMARENYPVSVWSEKSVEGHNGSIITRFGVVPLLFSYDLESATNKVFVLKSKFHKTLTSPWDGKGNSVNEDLKGKYLQTLYDPYRHFYYSVYSHETPVYNAMGELNNLDDRLMSIIIADTLFRYRGEVLLEKRKYFRSLFVGKEGLYVSTANNHNIDEKEDLMRFQLFKIKNL